MRGAQPLVGRHGFNRVGLFLVGAIACQSLLVKAVLRALVSPAFVSGAERYTSSQSSTYLKMKRVWVIGLLFALLAFGE